jgi:hypothetical protein
VYAAILEPDKEIFFADYLLDSIGMNIKLPLVVSCDNIGDIFMAENSRSGV